MPKTDIDYSKIIMYKIVCKDLNIKDCYVGSTTNFTKRKNAHKSICHNEKTYNHNLKVYQFIRQNGGWNNWDMVLIESYPCLTHLEALKRERHWIEQLNASLNQFIPSRTHQEFQIIYNQKNKNKMIEYRKEYREKNREKILKYNKEYQEKNSDLIKQKNKIVIKCECGAECTKRNIASHKKTKKHLNLVNQ